MKKIVVLSLLMLSLGCSHRALWLEVSTPVNGPKGGRLMYKNNPTKLAAYRQAAEFCAPDLHKVVAERVEFGERGIMMVRGIATSTKPLRIQYIDFICLNLKEISTNGEV